MNKWKALLCLCIAAFTCSSAFAQTQTFFTETGTSSTVTQCDGHIYDGGGNNAPYADNDGQAYTDILVVCPDNPSSQSIMLTFQTFDIAFGDKLMAFDGDNIDAPMFTADSPLAGSGSGVSVADSPGGGWVQSSCENITGCITLKFTRNGDYVKGAGFRAEVQCTPRENTYLDCGRIFDFNRGSSYVSVADCSSGTLYVPIPIPEYLMCDEYGTFEISGSCVEGLPKTVEGTGTGTIGAEFPIGEHFIVFTTLPYGDKECVAHITVLTPPLACNDNINVSLSSECIVTITPDLILEDVCEPDYITRPIDGALIPAFDYEITVDAMGDAQVIGTTVEGYPLVDFSNVACGTAFDVNVKRYYLNDADCDGNYFDGYDYDDTPIMDECWGQIIVEDKVKPVITAGPPALAIPCYENNGILDILNGFSPNGEGLGGQLYLPLLDATLNISGAQSLQATENCKLEFSASEWEEMPMDCSEEQTVTDWMGNTYEAAVFVTYKRDLRASDRCGNESIYTQELFVLQPEFVAPLPEIEVSCDLDIDPHALQAAWFDWLADGRPANDPRAAYAAYLPNFDNTSVTVVGGNPLTNGDYEVTDASGDEVPIDLSHSDCGYAIDWTDGDPIPTCGGGYKFFREWTVYNWCNGIIEFNGAIPQIIKVSDIDAPVILDSIPYNITDVTGEDCTGSVTFYPPTIRDECSNVTSFIQIDTDTRVFDSYGVTFDDFTIGEEVVIKMTATDACGNSSSRTDTVMIKDIVPPTTICEQIRTVALNNDCTVEVPASSFDDGSYDNCGGVIFEVARMDADSDGDGFPEEEDYGDRVAFSAFDLENGCGGTTMVVLRVSDTYGNSNICMVEVMLQDKIPPSVEDVYTEVACDDSFINTLIDLAALETESERADVLINLLTTQQIGALSSDDNCSTGSGLDVEIITTDFSGFDVTCRNGVLKYYFHVLDNCGNQSATHQGTIIVNEANDWFINFPADVELHCEESNAGFTPLELNDMMVNNGCDNWGLEVTEEKFETSEDACYKKVFTYHFINWCTWNPSNSEIAIVERPEGLITNELHTVAIRFRDVFQNDPATGELLTDAQGQFIIGADGMNDIDDGNEDFDFNPGQYNSGLTTNYIYRAIDVDGNGSSSYQETRSGLSPIQLPPTVFDGQTSRVLTETELLNDGDESVNFDIYDVTNSPIDGDFVIIDNFDSQDIPTYSVTSQFSNSVKTYVSAQAYGNFAYRQIVKLYDDNAPTIDVTQDGPFCGGEDEVANGDVCNAFVDVRFIVGDGCTLPEDMDVNYQLSAFGGAAVNDPFGALAYLGDGVYRIEGYYPIRDGGLPTNHAFIVSIVDGCGNSEVLEIPFEVKDCKAPTAYCLFGLSATMDENGEVLLWASDFDAGSNDFCTAMEDIRLTFADPALYPDSTSRTFRCADGEIGTVQVFLWAQDLVGNTSFCETFITIQGSSGCSTSSGAAATIGGDIMTTNDEYLESVEVTLSGSAGEMAEMMGDGTYHFDEVDLGYDYTVTAYKNDGALNGVSTFDLVLMNRHVLNTRPLEDPYQLIAADINNSGGVSTFDIVLLRKLILNIDTEFTQNTSWRFIPMDFEFTDPMNPWATPFPEVININNFSEEDLNADFMAIKIGDVNGSASASNNAQNVEGRSQWTNKELQVRAIETFEGYRLDFYAPELVDLDGFQFSLDFDAHSLEMAGFDAGVLNASNFGLNRVSEGLIYVSWNTFGAHDWTGSDKLFSLSFNTSATAEIEELMEISTDALQAEAYDKNGEFYGLAMKWIGGKLDKPVLYQNTPNPFKQSTTIAFELPEAGNASIEVRDLTGKTLSVLQGEFEQGYNTVTIDKNTLPQAGVFYYSLKTASHQTTRKMILIK